MATKSEVGNDIVSRPPNSASNGLDAPRSNAAFTGNGPNVKSLNQEKQFSYNGSARIMNNSMDPSGNSSPSKPNIRARPNVNMPNNGPVPGGTMHPPAQPTSGPAAPNVDPFSEGVNLPPDAMMNKTSGGIGYNIGPGASGDAFGGAGGYGYGRSPNFPGITNQMPPSNDMYQGPGAPTPSNPMPNSYNQYDPMTRNYNAPTPPVSRGFGSQFGHNNMPRASSSPRPPGISSSAPTLSQLLQGQKPQYNFPNNYPQSDVSGRGPDHGAMPNQYWGGQPRINPSMTGQMPVGYPNRSQMNMPDNHMMSRRPYGGSPGMVPGAPPYSQQSMPQYNRQYPQMYPTQQLARPPVSRGIYAPQAMPPPYGPQSQAVNFGAAQQQQPGPAPAGFGSHVQQQPQAQSQGGNTPHSQAPSVTPAQPNVPQQPPSSLPGSQGLPAPQPTSQPNQSTTPQPPATSQHMQSPGPQQQVGQPMQAQQGGRTPMGGQQGGQMSHVPQGGPPMTHQGPIVTPPSQGAGMPQLAPAGQGMTMTPASSQLQQMVAQSPQGYPAMAQQQQQQQGSWQPQSLQRNQPQDVASSQPPPQVKLETTLAPQPGQPPSGPNGTPQVSRLQQQEAAGSRPSSLPDLSGCIDDLPTGSEAGTQSAPANSTPSNNQASQSPAAAVPPTDIKPKVEPGSNPPSQPPTPVPQPPPTQPPAGTGVIKPSPSPVGSPASLVSRTSHSPASAHSGSVTPQPQMALGPGGHVNAEKGMERLSQSPIVQPNDMKGNMVRPGYRGGPSASFGNTSAMGNMGYDNRIRPGMDPYSNSQQTPHQQSQCNDYSSNNSIMGGPGQDPVAHPMRTGTAMNSGNPFPPNYSGGGGPPAGGMGYKPMTMPNPHIPQRPDGPYSSGGPNVQRFGMRGMAPSSMGPQQNMIQGDPMRPGAGGYPPPYPAQQQPQQWPPVQQQTPNSHHIPGMPPGGAPYQQTNNSFIGGHPQSSAAVCSTTQNLTGSSTATSSTVVSTANSTSDTRSTVVTQSITMPVTTPMTVSSGPAEHLLSSQTPIMAQIIKKENEDGMQQIKMEANNSLPALPQGLSQPSPMASPSTMSKSSQEDVTSGTASPCPPTVGTPTPRPASQGNQIVQQPTAAAQKKTDGTSNGLVLNRKVMKLYELSDDPNRKPFLDALLKFMDDRGQPIKATPQVASHILDLFRLYYLVKEKGGVIKVSKTKQWKAVASTLAIGNSNSAAYTLKKNYIRYLLPYDCYYDRNNLDPAHIIAEIDTTGSKKKSKKKEAAAQPGVVGSPMFNNVPYDQYGPRHPKPGYPPYSNQMHPSMYPPHQMGHPRGGPMPPNSGAIPQMPNSMGNNITVRDPFSEMDTPHMPPSAGGNPAYNSAYPGGGPMAPTGQFRPQLGGGMSGGMGGGMPNNDMYNQGPYGDMRNSGVNPADPFGTMARRDVPPGSMGGKPEAFNRTGPTIPPPTAEPYPGANQNSTLAGMPPGAAPNTVQQFQQSSQERPFIPPSSSSQPPQSSTPVPPTSSTAVSIASSNNTSSSSMPPHGTHTPPSMGQQLQPSGGGGYRFPAPNMGARAPAPNSQQTYTPPPPYSGAPAGPYGDQSQQPTMTSGPPMGQGTPPQVNPTSRFPDPNSSPFPPNKRPSDSYSPVASKRQDTMGPQPGHMAPDASGQMPQAMPPYGQGFYPDSGDRPHPPGGGHPHTAGHPSGFPFGPRSSQPGPMPPHQGMGGSGMHPGMSWGPMKARSMPPSGMRGPPPGGYPGTLQQALTGNYPRERYQPSGGLNKPAKLPPHQLPTMSPHNKKEVVFPPDSIEASQPATTKVQRKTGKDVGSVEFWRVMMALKSGLLAESTWALDILSVLLYDDSTVVSFDLKQLKGLLELLVDYYRAVLRLIFGGFLSSGSGDETDTPTTPAKRKGGAECPERAECSTSSKRRRRTIKRWSNRTHNHSDLERLKGSDKSKQVKLDHQPRSGPLHKSYPEENSEDSERKHLEVLPLRIIHQFDTTTESNECLSQKYIQEPGEDDNSAEWQRYCSEELRLVKGHSRLSGTSSKTTKLMYTSQCRQRPDETVAVLEDEEMRDDVPSMISRNDAQVSVSKRCKCISNILRGLSFIPANSPNFASNPKLLALLGRILLLDHGHAERQAGSRRYGERTEGQDHDAAKDSKDGEPGEWFDTKEEATDYEGDPISCDNWSLDCLNSIREDALVIINNISGQLDFSLYQESISLPILDGLLHWSVCLSASALDPFPLLPATSPLSPKRLSVEALAKLSLRENNVDMILATPPFERLERLFGYLTQYVGDRKEPVLRELSIVLLSSLAQEEMLASRSIACQKSAVSFLLCYLEDSEYARSLEKDKGAAQFIVGSDIQSPNGCMMRRATSALASLAKVPENHPLFLQHQTRLLNLSMSPLVDSSVRELIAEALFHLGSAG